MQKLCNRTVAMLLTMLLVLILSVMALLRSSYNPFLYFRF